MYCSKCGTENEDDASFCKKCGLPFPATTPPATPPRPKKSNAGWILLGLMFVAFLVVLIASTQSSGSSGQSVRRHAIVRLEEAPCGSSPTALAQMVAAAKDTDVLGYLALSKRDGNMLLSKGTKVEVLNEDSGMSAVWVSEGEHRDTNCWIPSKALDDAN